MEQSLVKIESAWLALLHRAFAKDGAWQPFVREIMLIECHIAGTSYRDVKSVESTLAPGALLVLKREPQNPQLPRSRNGWGMRTSPPPAHRPADSRPHL
jgi:hypothetical protein